MLNAIKPKTKTVVLYLLVPVVMFIFTVFVPLVTALVYSFFEWKGGPQKTFTGLDNYIKLFHDATFWEAFGHNIYLVIACIIGQIGIAFVLVMMVNSKLVKCKTIHRTFRIFPKHHRSSLYRFDLEYDLPQQVRYPELVSDRHRTEGSVSGMAE